MGFLFEAEPMPWGEAVDVMRYVREHGIEQFLAILSACRDIQGDAFRWGDEVEHGLFRLEGDGPDRTVKVSLRSPELLAELQEGEQDVKWVPEYGRWMLESTPPRPYDGVAGVLSLEPQLRLRRARLAASLREGEVAPTITSMPLFGVGDFCQPSAPAGGEVMQSLFVPDCVMNPHPRFPALSKNIRQRRGSKVDIRRPLLVDSLTHSTARDSAAPAPQTVGQADAMGEVYADSMAFGMGACCLQVTMQAASLDESLRLYDQLAPLAPLMLALTAATPFMRGWLCDDDVRWGQIAQSVDDRTLPERGLPGGQPDARLAGEGVRRLRKSRYDSIDCYIGEDSARFNDVPLALDDEHVQRLREAGTGEQLAKHVAHLFARDPLVMFGDRLELDDGREVDHWENLQSTNWQTLRWKPPPPQKGALPCSHDDHIGWRVEFRSMEVQLTDFESTAFIAFIVVLSRAILELDLDLRIPMSKVEENMDAAQRRDAYVSERFWFRAGPDGEAAKMSLDQILSGSADGSFAGLIPLCRKYLATSTCDAREQAAIERYLDFVGRRAAGSTMTAASWMRRFVMSHPSYERDSRIPSAAAHDLVRAAAEIGAEQRACPEVLGDAKLEWESCSQCTECGQCTESCSSSEAPSAEWAPVVCSRCSSERCAGRGPGAAAPRADLVDAVR